MSTVTATLLVQLVKYNNNGANVPQQQVLARMGAPFGPREIALISKNFSQRPEDALSTQELEELRRVRSQLSPNGWRDLEAVGRAAEKARRRRERELATTSDTPASTDATLTPLRHTRLHARVNSGSPLASSQGVRVGEWESTEAVLLPGVLRLRLHNGHPPLDVALAAYYVVPGGGIPSDGSGASEAPTPFLFRLVHSGGGAAVGGPPRAAPALICACGSPADLTAWLDALRPQCGASPPTASPATEQAPASGAGPVPPTSPATPSLMDLAAIGGAAAGARGLVDAIGELSSRRRRSSTFNALQPAARDGADAAPVIAPSHGATTMGGALVEAAPGSTAADASSTLAVGGQHHASSTSTGTDRNHHEPLQQHEQSSDIAGHSRGLPPTAPPRRGSSASSGSGRRLMLQHGGIALLPRDGERAASTSDVVEVPHGAAVTQPVPRSRSSSVQSLGQATALGPPVQGMRAMAAVQLQRHADVVDERRDDGDARAGVHMTSDWGSDGSTVDDESSVDFAHRQSASRSRQPQVRGRTLVRRNTPEIQPLRSVSPPPLPYTRQGRQSSAERRPAAALERRGLPQPRSAEIDAHGPPAPRHRAPSATRYTRSRADEYHRSLGIPAPSPSLRPYEYHTGYEHPGWARGALYAGVVVDGHPSDESIARGRGATTAAVSKAVRGAVAGALPRGSSVQRMQHQQRLQQPQGARVAAQASAARTVATQRASPTRGIAPHRATAASAKRYSPAAPPAVVAVPRYSALPQPPRPQSSSSGGGGAPSRHSMPLSPSRLAAHRAQPAAAAAGSSRYYGRLADKVPLGDAALWSIEDRGTDTSQLRQQPHRGAADPRPHERQTSLLPHRLSFGEAASRARASSVSSARSASLPEVALTSNATGAEPHRPPEPTGHRRGALVSPPRQHERQATSAAATFRALSPGVRRTVMWPGQVWPVVEAVTGASASTTTAGAFLRPRESHRAAPRVDDDGETSDGRGSVSSGGVVAAVLESPGDVSRGLSALSAVARSIVAGTALTSSSTAAPQPGQPVSRRAAPAAPDVAARDNRVAQGVDAIDARLAALSAEIAALQAQRDAQRHGAVPQYQGPPLVATAHRPSSSNPFDDFGEDHGGLLAAPVKAAADAGDGAPASSPIADATAMPSAGPSYIHDAPYSQQLPPQNVSSQQHVSADPAVASAAQPRFEVPALAATPTTSRASDGSAAALATMSARIFVRSLSRSSARRRRSDAAITDADSTTAAASAEPPAAARAASIDSTIAMLPSQSGRDVTRVVVWLPEPAVAAGQSAFVATTPVQQVSTLTLTNAATPLTPFLVTVCGVHGGSDAYAAAAGAPDFKWEIPSVVACSRNLQLSAVVRASTALALSSDRDALIVIAAAHGGRAQADAASVLLDHESEAFAPPSTAGLNTSGSSCMLAELLQALARKTTGIPWQPVTIAAVCVGISNDGTLARGVEVVRDLLVTAPPGVAALEARPKLLVASAIEVEDMRPFVEGSTAVSVASPSDAHWLVQALASRFRAWAPLWHHLIVTLDVEVNSFRRRVAVVLLGDAGNSAASEALARAIHTRRVSTKDGAMARLVADIIGGNHGTTTVLAIL